MMRCRTGIVAGAAFDTIPDQQRTATLRYALHCIRETESV